MDNDKMLDEFIRNEEKLRADNGGELIRKYINRQRLLWLRLIEFVKKKQ